MSAKVALAEIKRVMNMPLTIEEKVSVHDREKSSEALREWNIKQMMLFQHLVKEGLTDMSDMNVWGLLGAWFFNYVDQVGEYPTDQDVEEWFVDLNG